MSSFVINGKALADASNEYLSERDQLIKEYSESISKTNQFGESYKVSLALDMVLSAFDKRPLVPGITPLRAINVRIPLLVSLGQGSLAEVELRRFLELCLWTVYFTHHPVEWKHFSSATLSGFSRDARKPIAYAAHRDLSFYTEYANEYFEKEPSGEALISLRTLENDKRLLNAAVHPGSVARTPEQHPPVKEFAVTEVKKIVALQRRILLHSCLLLCAFDRDGFNALTATSRAYFDWLIGKAISRRIRSGLFGLKL